MASLELIAGNFGAGRAEWVNYEFHLPKKQRLPIEAVVSVEENGEHLERSVLGFLSGGVHGAFGFGATAAVVGVFAAPLAAVGAIGLTAAAIGGGIGAIGGSVERKVLVQVMGADGRGFIAICEQGVPAEISKAVSVAHAMRMRQREAEKAATRPAPRLGISAVWEKRPRAPAAEPVVQSIAALPAPETVVDLEPNADGIFTVAGKALASTAESAGSAASEAYAATTGAVEGAWSAVRARLPWPAGT